MTALELILHLAEGSTTPNTLQHIAKIARQTIKALAEQPAQPQEPVAYLVRKKSWAKGHWECAPQNTPDYGRMWADERMPVYTSPPAQRKPLTDEQLYKVFPAIATYTEANKTLYRSIARAIEAAHSIKENT